MIWCLGALRLQRVSTLALEPPLSDELMDVLLRSVAGYPPPRYQLAILICL